MDNTIILDLLNLTKNKIIKWDRKNSTYMTNEYYITIKLKYLFLLSSYYTRVNNKTVPCYNLSIFNSETLSTINETVINSESGESFKTLQSLYNEAGREQIEIELNSILEDLNNL